MKKLLKRIIPILIALPFILYIAIIITNNNLANKVEDKLKSYPLPDETVLVDSVSAAGKLVGNGNGMQYMGSILVSSNLSEEELLKYYSVEFKYVEVRKQNSPTLDFVHPITNLSFKNYDDTSNLTYYCITDWGSKLNYDNELLFEFLNFDLRGH